MIEPLLLTADEVANILRVSTRTVRNLRQAGALSFVRLSSRKILYKPEDVDAFIERNRVREEPRKPTLRTKVVNVGSLAQPSTGGFLARRERYKREMKEKSGK